MNPLELALARSNAYRLFSLLLLNGVTEESAELVRQIPDLEKLVDFERGYPELAADHYALFVHNLPPYASIFLEDSAQPGGDITEATAKSYKECGYRVQSQGEAADHIGHMLGCLSFLCGAESDAWEDGAPHIAGQMRQIQIEFLEQRLLPWVFPFVWAVRSQPNRFYRLLVDLAADIATDHYQALGSLHSPFSTPLAQESLLGGEDTKLKEIVDFMLKPARSGLWLSSDKINQLGRRYELPRGFGERRTLLTNLLKAAGKYDSFPKLMQEFAADFSEAHIEFENIRNQRPELAPFLYSWSLKIGGTSGMLHKMETMWRENESTLITGSPQSDPR